MTESPDNLARSDQPHALIIEDHDDHALIAGALLREVGFSVERAASLWEGKQRAFALLERSRPARPTLILLDLLLPDAANRELEGTLLAVLLNEAMAAGLLHPAHLVAMTSELTEERRLEAQIAGCALVLQKQLRPHHVATLRALVDQPPARPGLQPEEPGSLETRTLRKVLHRAARMIIQADAPPSLPAPPAQAIWDAEHTWMLLIRPTSLLGLEPWASWLLQRGGINDLRRRLSDLPLEEKLYRLLLKTLEPGPSDHAGYYTSALNISKSTYIRYRESLLNELVHVLNSW